MPRPVKTLKPLNLLMLYGHWYKHGKERQWDHLYLFSKHKVECEGLLLFGGSIYRQRGGWCWMCGNLRQLLSIAKLMEAREEDLREEMRDFIQRVKSRAGE